MADLEAEARGVYRGNLCMASDLQRYTLDRHGVLAEVASGNGSG
jgi:hypothetical protein